MTQLSLTGAKAHAQAQWSETPCGSLEGDRTSADYFAAVDRDRYVDHAPWLPAVMGFARFRDADVIEVGFGQGTDLMQFALGGARSVAGLDLSHAHLDLATRRFALAGREADLRLHDAETRWPFEDATRDVVYSLGVLHHTPHPERALAEAYRVLRPGGRLIVGMYHRRSLFAFHHALNWWRFYRHENGDGYEASWWRIEAHSDTTEARPLVNRYTRAELRDLVTRVGFRPVRMTVEHFGVQDSPYFKRLPRRLWGWLARRWGWYVVIEAVKPG